jgi:hypothetical protein
MAGKTKLEQMVSDFLDEQKINSTYKPNEFEEASFYLPELKVWVVVGANEETVDDKITSLVPKIKKGEVMVWAPSIIYYYARGDTDELEKGDLTFYGVCSKCKKLFFCDNVYSFHCRACGTHEGDHDIRGDLSSFWQKFLDSGV